MLKRRNRNPCSSGGPRYANRLRHHRRCCASFRRRLRHHPHHHWGDNFLRRHYFRHRRLKNSWEVENTKEQVYRDSPALAAAEENTKEPDYCGSPALASAAECNSASRILAQDGWCYSSSAELQPLRRPSLLR